MAPSMLLKRMAGTTGLEPAASAVTGQRSNQLNYVPNLFVALIGNPRVSWLNSIQTSLQAKPKRRSCPCASNGL